MPSPAVRPPGSLDVETVRCALEHEARAALRALGEPPPRVARTLADARRALSERAFPLTAELAPELAVLAPLACASLGLQHTRVELWHAPAPRLAACVPVAAAEEPVALVLLLGDAVLEELGTDAMFALLTHELGHHLAHGTEETAVPGEAPASRAPVAFCRNSHRIACEITADRLALVGCRDLEAHLRLDTPRTAAPLDRVEARERVRVLLSRSLEVIEQFEREQRWVALEAESYERALRVWAAARFVETDRYRELTGLGSGSVALDALDAVISARVRGPVPLTQCAERGRAAEPMGSLAHSSADVAWLATVATLGAVERDLEGAEREMRSFAVDALETARPSAERVADGVDALARRAARLVRKPRV